MNKNWPFFLKKISENIIKKIDWKKTTPSKDKALNFLKMDPNEIKIIILGQDPYPKNGVANGRAFAVNENTPIPSSLKQIFKEIKLYQNFIQTNRTLKTWEDKGILLLNVYLTTEIGKPLSHKYLWEPFTYKVIKFLGISKNKIWVLWGKEALKYKSLIKSKHILVDAHPSPLARKYRKGTWVKEINKINNIIF